MERTIKYRSMMKVPGIRITALVSAWFLFMSSGLLHATQPQRLAADRPGFAWGTHTVTPGSFYLETGFQYSFFNDSHFSNYSSVPVFNLRIGIVNNLELFVSWDGWDIYHQRNENGINTDNHDLNLPLLGVKYKLVTAEYFTFTLLGLLEGNDDEGSFTVDPSLALLWDYSLTDNLELFGMAQAGTISASSGSEMSYSFAVGVGFPIAEKIEAFAEYFNMYNSISKKIYHGNEVGILFFLNDNIQLDVFGGYSYGKHWPHYLGAGFSQRF